MIRSGNVAFDLIRPVDLYNYWLARSFSGRAAPMIIRATPIIIIAALIGQLNAPASLTHAALFLISLTLGLILAVVFFAIVTITLLWTVSGEGGMAVAASIVTAVAAAAMLPASFTSIIA